MANELKLQSFKRNIGSNYFVEFQANEVSVFLLGITGDTTIQATRKSVIPQKESAANEIDATTASQKVDRIASQSVDISVRKTRALLPLQNDYETARRTFERGGRNIKLQNASLLFPEGINLIIVSHVIAVSCSKLNQALKLYKGKRLFRRANRAYHPIAEFDSAYLNGLVTQTYTRASRTGADVGNEATTEPKGVRK